MSVVTLAVLKSYFETGDFPTQSQFIDLIDTLGGGSSYKRYVALLDTINNPNATDPPVVTVLENNLGGTVVWTRDAAGQFTGTLAGAFTAGKTSLLISNQDGTIFGIYWIDVNSIFVGSGFFNYGNDVDIALTDRVLANATVEIRVYV